MNLVKDVENVIQNVAALTYPVLTDELQSVINRNIYSTEQITAELIDMDFLDEIKNLIAYENVPVYFGKTLRDIKCVILDEGLRKHPLFIKYKNPRKLVVTSVTLPHSPFQEREYNSLEEIIGAFRRHVDSLSGYFYELEQIDRLCTILEPAEPSFKYDYRRILLEDRIWLHVEVTPDGSATNVHLLNHSEVWGNKLHQGLLSWDHDKDIIDNILTMFDLVHFPTLSSICSTTEITTTTTCTLEAKPKTEVLCSICLCNQLDGSIAVPLPLCVNPSCGVHFHRSCLYEWLVSCGGGRPPPFGVATGSCPACLDPATCCEKDI